MNKTASRPTALIVDDSLTNRALLGKILADDFKTEQAENGVLALKKLRELPDVDVVILDLEMPELDGFGVLEAMRGDERLRDIPVVVDTIVDDVGSQIKALDAGAVDVLIKPFNPQIALHRVRNILARRESERLAAQSRTLEALLRQSEVDEKTGLYNKQAFCRKTAELLRENPHVQYLLLRRDIDHFKVLNDVFGVNSGDELLAKTGELYREKTPGGCVHGHWEADHFVSCVPRELYDKGLFDWQGDESTIWTESGFEIVTRLGIYEIIDPTLDVELMCDRALLALRSIKGDYARGVAFYDDSMREALLEEQEIVSEMQRALDSGQFEAWFQPQYNHATGALIGAEALARWRHPVKGIIAPGVFVPIFERNGFIYELDKCIWEQACKLLRKWMDAGYPPLPVSVNISRHDVFHEDFYTYITGLIS